MHRHRTHPSPYLVICPYETVSERFNTAHYEFPRHLTLLPPFILPHASQSAFVDAVNMIAGETADFTVTFDDPDVWMHDDVEYRVQKVSDGRLLATELHLKLLKKLHIVGGTIIDHATAGLHYTPHTNLMERRAPYSPGQKVPVRTIMLIAKYPKGFMPIGEHEELGDVTDKFMYQGYRLKGSKVG